MRLPKWFSFSQITAFFVYFSHLTQLLLSPVVFFSSLSTPVLAVGGEPEVQLTLDRESNELVLNVLEVTEANVELEYTHDGVTEGISDHLTANAEKMATGRWLAGTRSSGENDEVLYEVEEGRVSINATDLNDQTFLFAADFKLNNDTLWLQNGDVWSTFNLESGRTYQAPQNDQVRLEFTKIDTDSAEKMNGLTALHIKEVSLSNEQQAKLGSVSSTAYDITSNLSDLAGVDFEYNLTLPNPAADNPDVQVKYSQDGENFENVAGEEIANDTVTIRGLDHFTVFVVVDDGTNSNSDNDNWSSDNWSNHGTGYQGDHHWVTPDRIGDQAIWTLPDDAANGEYQVLLSWTTWNDHEETAHYTSNFGLDETINQKLLANGNSSSNGTWSGWYLSGKYNLSPGDNISLIVESNDTGNLSADAMMFVKTPVTEIWVDDDWQGFFPGQLIDDEIIYGVNAFDSITEALGAIKDQGTIHVYGGTYQEFSVNKSVSIISKTNPDGNDPATIRANSDLTDHIVEIHADDVNLEGFLVSGKSLTFNSSQLAGIIISPTTSNPTISNININKNIVENLNCKSDNCATKGIQTYTDWRKDSKTVSNITISENVINNISSLNKGGYGIQTVDRVENININGNHISNVKGSWAFGIAVDNHGSGSYEYAKNIKITDNTFNSISSSSPNDASILIEKYILGNEVQVHQNQITTGLAGLVNLNSKQVNATDNWWGFASGPFDDVDDDGSIPTENPDGEGNAVIGNVLYGNWADNLGFDNDYPNMQNIKMYVNGKESYLAKPGDTIRVTAEIIDDSDINKVQIWVRENPWNPNHNQITWGTMNNVENNLFEFVFNLPEKYESDDPINEKIEGNYFNFRPFDEYGNSHIGWAQKFTVDSTPPAAPTGLHRLDKQSNQYSCGNYTSRKVMIPHWNRNEEEDFSHYEYSSFHPSGSQGINEKVLYQNSFSNNWIAPVDGTYGFAVRAVDNAGNKSDWSLNSESLEGSCTINFDSEKPPIPQLQSPQSGDIVTGNPKQTWTSSDDDHQYIYESYYDSELTQPIYTTSVNKNYRTVGGNQTIEFWWRVKAVDQAGNESDWSDAWNLIIDNTLPNSTISEPSNDGSESQLQTNDWTGYIAGSASDNNSGVSQVNLEVTYVPFTNAEAKPVYWNGSAWQATATQFSANSTNEDNTSWEYQLPSEEVEQGFYTLTSHAVDNAGNVEQTYTISLVYDHTIPEVTATTDPVNPDGVDGWFITEPTVTLTGTDNHELDHIEYQWGNTSGKWLTYDPESPLLVTEVGQHFLYYRGVDVVGNQAEEENIGLKEIKYDPAQTGEVLGATDSGGDGTDGGGDTGGTGGGEVEPYVCEASEPGDITGLTIAGTGLNSITLNWNAATNATNYNMIFTDTVTGTNYGATDIGSGPYTLGNLVVGRQYVIQVFAENDCQPGNSASITASTNQGGTVVGGPTAGGQPAGEVLGADTEDTASVGEEGASTNGNSNSDQSESGEVLGASTDCENFPWWWLAIVMQIAGLVIIFIFASDSPWVRLGLLGLLTAIDGYLIWRWLCSPWLWIGGVVIVTPALELLWRYFNRPSQPQIKISKK